MEITLSRGATCLIDEEDFKRLPGPLYFDGRYARITMPKNKYIYLHRFVSGIKTIGTKKIVVDHINMNKLDNRKNNLRIVSQSINILNSVYKNKSGLKGVYFDKSRPSAPWSAQIRARSLGSIRVFIGRFKTKELAHKAYLKKRMELFGI